MHHINHSGELPRNDTVLRCQTHKIKTLFLSSVIISIFPTGHTSGVLEKGEFTIWASLRRQWLEMHFTTTAHHCSPNRGVIILLGIYCY
uniref:Uncharacterized protein n=1 Tax=Anguilla anguilla TaxID=7936 RepID=A0A0E9X5J4_ANGAN